MKVMPLKKMERKKSNEIDNKLGELISNKVPERVHQNLKKKLRY